MLGDFDRYDCDPSTPPVEPNAITEMPVREDAPESTVDDEGLPSSGAPAEERLGLAKVDRKQVFAALFDTKKPEPQEPETLGRFRVTGQLGRGGMGTVLEGYDPSLDRKVAIKVLHDKAGGRHRDRLVREAQALAQLSHPNVVQVFETGEVDGRLFIAMELVPGQTLRAWQSEPHGWAECVQIYVQAGRGLAAAHAVDIVHRDFKPANCIVDEQGRVRVLDFGLARGWLGARGGGFVHLADGADDGRAGLARLGLGHQRDRGREHEHGASGRSAAHPDGHHARHAGVHGPRAAPSRARGRALGPVQLLCVAL